MWSPVGAHTKKKAARSGGWYEKWITYCTKAHIQVNPKKAPTDRGILMSDCMVFASSSQAMARPSAVKWTMAGCLVDVFIDKMACRNPLALGKLALIMN